jgi:hypothetical protein
LIATIITAGTKINNRADSILSNINTDERIDCPSPLAIINTVPDNKNAVTSSSATFNNPTIIPIIIRMVDITGPIEKKPKITARITPIRNAQLPNKFTSLGLSLVFVAILNITLETIKEKAA